MKSGYSPVQEAAGPVNDIRRDPNYALYLFLIIIGLFAMAMAYLFL